MVAKPDWPRESRGLRSDIILLPLNCCSHQRSLILEINAAFMRRHPAAARQDPPVPEGGTRCWQCVSCRYSDSIFMHSHLFSDFSLKVCRPYLINTVSLH